MLPARETIPNYDGLRAVKPLPILTDWENISKSEFRARFDDCPVVLRGVGHRTRAFTKWSNAFFLQYGDEKVQVRCPFPLSFGDVGQWAASTSLKNFVASVGQQRGLYLAEWYFFKSHPEALCDITHAVPDYLLDDWFELIPEQFAFASGTRNNIYWGADGSNTTLHWDNLEAVTWNITLRGTKRWLLFSGRPFRTYDFDVAMKRMEKCGLLKEGFISPEALASYASVTRDDLPALEFYAGDVGPGDLLFIPRRWAHQVHNIGECLSVARYFVSDINFDDCAKMIRDVAGKFPHDLLRALLGGEKRRKLLKSSKVRQLLNSKPSVRMFRLAMRVAGVASSNFMDVQPPSA